MDFHSMFEEMHAAMAEMMDVRRAMMDRMFGGFGPSVFPWFSALREDFERDFQRDFGFPGAPRLTEHPTAARTTAAAPAAGGAGAVASGGQPAEAAGGQPPQHRGPAAAVGEARSPAMGTSVMYSTQQYCNSADPSKNYSRHTTTQAGPGGVLESRTAVRDSREGEERVEVRRQLGDRYTHVTRKRRLDTGEETVERKSHNLQSQELAPFEEEWSRLAKEFLPMYRSPQSVPQGVAALGEPGKAAEVAGGGALPVGNAPAPTPALASAQAQHTAAVQK